MNALCHLVQHISHERFFSLTSVHGLQQCFKFAEQIVVVSMAAARARVQVQFIGKNAETHRIALVFQQLYKCSSGVDGELQLVHVIALRACTRREIHGGRSINKNVATQVGFLLVFLYEKFFSTRKKFPIHVPCAFTSVVLAVFGKLHAEAVERAFVQSRYEALNGLLRQ